ncbi:NUDIX domain-containing protein [Malaciobacter marinus]|uniref:NUDIX domain-containing protein n=1 Tax=Malaciobacter marinus TaxID=505249 RepID=UPI0009A60EBE|nr:NUDIX hydrolase [Malaciobacter marinus]SKB54189.1 UDP-sugar diphosphatase [Malaciobacter marinus]
MNTKITNFKTHVLDETKFVHPVKITFEQDGKSRSWEAVKSFDSVAVLLFHEEKNAFLLVKQFRPPVYLNDKSKTFTYELCAGLVDKNKDLNQIVKEEIDEECGYDVPLKNIEKVTSFYTNVGISGGCQNLYFARINESMKVHDGGGINDEQIELIFIPFDDFKDFIYDESKAKTPGLMFSYYWFLDTKKSKITT